MIKKNKCRIIKTAKGSGRKKPVKDKITEKDMAGTLGSMSNAI